MVEVKELRGVGASRGRAKGFAIVAFSPEEAHEKIKNASSPVLVTLSTSPEWTPIFFRVKAIVTEMGGMLSHAAIVAREVGIPCVAGVSNATSIIEDMDEVEVDGERGVVIVFKKGRT
jgi:pyruvate,water dikinase